MMPKPKFRTGALLCGTALQVLILGAPTLAQAADVASSTSTVAEVLVTARRKEERLIDVPVAATVLTSKDVEQYSAKDLGSIGALLPGVSFVRAGGGGSGATLAIRGVGNLAGDYGTEQPVALVIDGMPLTRGHAIDIGVFDLESVQVLKGPQALFFGKNSPAGVVALTSVNPGREFGGYLQGGYEFRTNTSAFEGAVNLPVNDTLAVRISGRYSRMAGGYVKNVATAIPDPFAGESTFTLPGARSTDLPGTRIGIVRGTVRWTPTDAFDATFKMAYADYYDRAGAGTTETVGCPAGDSAPAAGGRLDPFGDCKLNRRISRGILPVQIAANFFPGPHDDLPYNHSIARLATLTLNYRMPNVTFTSVSGYFYQVQSDFDNFDGTVYAQAVDYQDNKNRSLTQEFRAVTTFDGPVNVTAGGFLQDEHLDMYNTNKIAALGPFNGLNPANFPLFAPAPSQYVGMWNTDAVTAINRNRTYSVFGEISWKILENLELAGGARYTHEKHKTDLGNVFNRFDYVLGPLSRGNPLSPQGVRYTPEETSNNVSPQVTLTWHPQRNMTLYGAYKTGYLSGGAQNPGTLPNVLVQTGGTLTTRNTAAEDRALQYLPEKVKGGEVGLKGSFLDGRLTGDVTAFSYKYTNLQVIVFDAPTTTFTIHNADASRNSGFEAQGVFRVTDALTAHGSFIYSKLKFLDYTGAPCFGGQTAAQGCVAGGQDLSGERYGGPPFSWNLGANYEAPVGGDLRVAFGADVYGYDRTQLNLRGPNTAAPSYEVANASIRLFKPGSGWEVALIGNNIFNKLYQINLAADKPLGKPGTVQAIAGPPRLITVQVTTRF